MVMVAAYYMVSAVADPLAFEPEASLQPVQIDAAGALEIDCGVCHFRLLLRSPSRLFAYSWHALSIPAGATCVRRPDGSAAVPNETLRLPRHFTLAMASTVVPILVGVRVLRGFPRAFAAASATFTIALALSLLAWGRAGQMHASQLAAALTVAVLVSATGSGRGS
jgi:hypothetical protein